MLTRGENVETRRRYGPPTRALQLLDRNLGSTLPYGSPRRQDRIPRPEIEVAGIVVVLGTQSHRSSALLPAAN